MCHRELYCICRWWWYRLSLYAYGCVSGTAEIWFGYSLWDDPVYEWRGTLYKKAGQVPAGFSWFLDRKGQNELYCHMFNVSRDRFKCGKRYVSRGPIARVVKKALLNRIYLMKSWLLVKMKNGICAFCQIQFERVLLKNYGTIIFSGKIQLYTDFGMIL